VSLPLLLLVTAASFAQVSILPLLFLDPWSAPLLPVALVAAWSINRSPDQVWLALLPAALLPGIVSTQRIGWFLVALLPVALAGAAFAQSRAGEEHGLLWRLPASATVAGLGTFGYLLLLATVGRELAASIEAAPAIAAATLGTSALAALLAPLLQPRKRRQGLFA
jgi:hypothetical protein